MFGLHIYTFVFVYVRSYAYEPLFLGYHVFSRLLIYIALNRFTLTCSHDFCVHTIFLLFSIVRILQIPLSFQESLVSSFHQRVTLLTAPPLILYIRNPSWLTNLYLFIQSYKHDIKLTDKYDILPFRNELYTLFIPRLFYVLTLKFHMFLLRWCVSI